MGFTIYSVHQTGKLIYAQVSRLTNKVSVLYFSILFSKFLRSIEKTEITPGINL